MRIFTLLVLLLALLSACTSDNHQPTSRSIQADTDDLAASTPRSRSIPITTGTDNDGTLEVYGPLHSPIRLQLTVGLSTCKVVENYYFQQGALVRATSQRFYAFDPENLTLYRSAPAYTLDIFFHSNHEISRRYTGDPDQSATVPSEFPNRLLISQLLQGTRATGFAIDLVSPNPAPPIYYAD